MTQVITLECIKHSTSINHIWITRCGSHFHVFCHIDLDLNIKHIEGWEHVVRDDPKLQEDNIEAPKTKWSGWWFDSQPWNLLSTWQKETSQGVTCPVTCDLYSQKNKKSEVGEHVAFTMSTCYILYDILCPLLLIFFMQCVATLTTSSTLFINISSFLECIVCSSNFQCKEWEMMSEMAT